MKKKIEWHIWDHPLDGGTTILVAAPQLDKMLEDTFGRKIYDVYWPFVAMSELEGSALLLSIKSGQAETVLLPPSGAISETATPLGGGRYLVEYEVE